MTTQKNQEKLKIQKHRNQATIMLTSDKEALYKKELLLRSSTQVANVITGKTNAAATL